MSAFDLWIAEVTRALPSRTPAQKAAIAAELRDHFTTRLAQGYAPDDILAGFGDARSFAHQLGDDPSYQDVLVRRQWLHGLRGLIVVVGRSVTAAFALVIAGVCGLMAFAVLKIAAEELGLLGRTLTIATPDLGGWTLPVATAFLFCLWAAARLSLKLAVTSLRLDPAQ